MTSHRSIKPITSAIAGALLALASTSAVADPIIFEGTNGSLATRVEFSVSGTDLIVELSNTSTADVLLQSNLMSALFFDLDTLNNLVLQSAFASGPLGIYQQNSTQNSNANGALNNISDATNLAAPGSTNGGPGTFDGGWQLRENFGGLPGLTQTRGVGTNGLGVFNGSDVINTDNLDYALTSAGDNVATSQAQQLFNDPYIQNIITFTFSGLPVGFDLTAQNVSNVRVQYGTSLTEPSITIPDGDEDQPVPEPGTVFLLGAAALGLMGATRRRRNS
jgi:hypothetical protein